MTAQMTLPSSCDLSDVTGLRDALLSLRGDDLDLDGSAVERFGAPGLQILASAQKTWLEDGNTFRITAPSNRLIEIFKLANLEFPDAQS